MSAWQWSYFLVAFTPVAVTAVALFAWSIANQVARGFGCR